MNRTTQQGLRVGLALTLGMAGVSVGSGCYAGTIPAARVEKAAVMVPGTPVTAEQILATMQQTADAQTAALNGKVPIDWVGATMYTGYAALSHVAPGATGQAYFDGLIAMGNKVAWTPRTNKTNPYHADNDCIGQVFLEAYATKHDPAMIAPLKTTLDTLVDHLNSSPDAPANLTWWWCDALFMAPPVMARMSAETGDRKYIDAMDKEYWKVAGLLYDPQEHLFFRDHTFLKSKTPNGQKVFWSRGNGWVLAGLARVLQYMPQDYPSRPKYVALFKDMAAKLATLQGEDGLWRSSLLDAKQFPGPETSGTAFYCYGMAWGINNGILDKATYLPIVSHAWTGLLAARRPDGLPGYVQAVAGSPGIARPSGTQLYATGGLLLAGAELTKLAPLPAVDMPTLVAPPEPPKPASPPKPAVVEQPAPGATAFVRYVPERFDDIAWENDRVAFRVYGPALAAHPGDGPESGQDMWQKSTRRMILNDWYKAGDYHRDHGEGMDGYEVGKSRGCGGIGVWEDGKLYNALDWVTYKILQNGPDVASFQMTFAPWAVGEKGRKVWETRTTTLKAGSNLNHIETTIDSDQPGDLVIGVGIAKRKGEGGKLVKDKKKGILSYWEPETKTGTIGVGVLVDPSQIVGFAEDAENNIVLIKVTPGKPFVYYAGGCWSKGLDFHTQDDWEKYLESYVRG